jgi:hypothetical protein
MPNELIEQGGARLADFDSASAIAMGELEPVRFELEECLKPRAFLLGRASGRRSRA